MKLSCRREAARCFRSLGISQGHSRSLEIAPFDSSHTFYSNNDLILHDFREAEFCQKSRFFHTLYLHSTRGPHKAWYEKTLEYGYGSCGEKFDDMFSRFNTIRAFVTDGHLTTVGYSARYAYASRS